MLKLTKDNYYTTEANMAYWSASLIKEFLSCPLKFDNKEEKHE